MSQGVKLQWRGSRGEDSAMCGLASGPQLEALNKLRFSTASINWVPCMWRAKPVQGAGPAPVHNPQGTGVAPRGPTKHTVAGPCLGRWEESSRGAVGGIRREVKGQIGALERSLGVRPLEDRLTGCQPGGQKSGEEVAAQGPDERTLQWSSPAGQASLRTAPRGSRTSSRMISCPDTAGPEAALEAEEWVTRRAGCPILISLRGGLRAQQTAGSEGPRRAQCVVGQPARTAAPGAPARDLHACELPPTSLGSVAASPELGVCASQLRVVLPRSAVPARTVHCPLLTPGPARW